MQNNVTNEQNLREAHSGAVEGGIHSIGTHPERLSHVPTAVAVKEQLERLLASPHFVSSPRCQLFLRYVVEATIRGDAESLKERNLGIELFKRDATYDTNANPVVRVAASEVRKKLAQYYYEPGGQGQIRIEIPVGSYVPHFSFPEQGPGNGKELHRPEAVQPGAAVDHAESTPVALPAMTVRPRRNAVKLAVLAAGLVAICLGSLGWYTMMAESPLEKFWAPVVKSPSPVFLYASQMRATQIQNAPVLSRNTGATTTIIGQAVNDTSSLTVEALSDSITQANIAGFLRSKRKQFSARSVGDTSYEDLQKGPVVLIGALDNYWTMQLMRNMRFQFNLDTQTGESWISDQKNPGVKLGAMKLSNGVPMTQDMAIVARVIDNETKQPMVIVAGLYTAGTLAAGTFVTDPQYLDAYSRSAPHNWQNGNLEILLSVNVIDGQPGSPRVVDSVVW